MARNVKAEVIAFKLLMSQPKDHAALQISSLKRPNGLLNVVMMW